MEIITGVERRRRWSLEEKLRIAAETEQPGAGIAEIAGAMRSAAACCGLAEPGEARRAQSGAAGIPTGADDQRAC